MKFFLTKGLKVESIPRLTWLSNNAHRIVSVQAIRYNNSNAGKMVASMKDGSQFHAAFWSFRGLIAWLFHSEYNGIPVEVCGLYGGEVPVEFKASYFTLRSQMVAGSADHWAILSKILSV